MYTVDPSSSRNMVRVVVNALTVPEHTTTPAPLVNTVIRSPMMKEEEVNSEMPAMRLENTLCAAMPTTILEAPKLATSGFRSIP